jgi:hypothetical protein
MPLTGQRHRCAAILGGARLTDLVLFRPAPLRGVQEWALKGTVLHAPDGRLELSQVRQARLVDKVIYGSRMRRLDLKTASGTTRIALSISRFAGHQESNLTAHLGLMRAVARRLAVIRPDLSVEIGESGGARLIMFGIGLVTLLSAVGMIVAMLMTGLSTDRMAAAAVPMLMLLALGALLVKANHPWRTLPSVPVATLDAVLDGLVGADAPRGEGDGSPPTNH